MAGAFATAQELRADRHMLRLEVMLTTAPTLPSAARTAMMVEAAGIWGENGVAIEWLSPSAVRPVAPDRLRVLVVPDRPNRPNRPADAAAIDDEPFAVGELVRPVDSHPVALISIQSARRLVTSLRGRAGYELIAVDDRRLGVVLGRALAHEIGHYLLDTSTHAPSGLMRPQFTALEFTDPRDGLFALDHDAAAWLRNRVAGKFEYARR